MKKKCFVLAVLLVVLFCAQSVFADEVSNPSVQLTAPEVTKLTSSKPGILKVAFTTDSQADSYEIQYTVNKNFKKAQSITVKKGASSQEIIDLIPGKKYYVRMRSYDSKSESYSGWGTAKNKKVKKGWTIVNAKSAAAIEADVTLSGSGTGYHAKLVIGTASSAVSFGLQYDKHAAAPYTGKTMALIENVASNNPGGQKYSRPGNKSLKKGKTYHLMMTVDKNGKGSVYLDYKKIGSFSNAGLKKQDVYLRIEACARLNGDKVKAVFKNIKLKKGKNYDPNRAWPTQYVKKNPTLKCKDKNGKITISGSVSGLGAGQDWDSAYESVSYIVQCQ